MENRSQNVDDDLRVGALRRLPTIWFGLRVRKAPSAVHAEIADRPEGRSPQHLEVSDFAVDLLSRSDGELWFSLQDEVF